MVSLQKYFEFQTFWADENIPNFEIKDSEY